MNRFYIPTVVLIITYHNLYVPPTCTRSIPDSVQMHVCGVKDNTNEENVLPNTVLRIALTILHKFYLHFERLLFSDAKA